MPTTGGRSSGKSARAPPCSSSSSRPAGTWSGSWRSSPPTCTGQRPYRAPPFPAPAARDGVHTFLRKQEVTAVTRVHLVWLPSAPTDDPRGPRALSPGPDWELWRDMWAAWLTQLPPQCRWMATGPRPHGASATAAPPSPPPLRTLSAQISATTKGGCRPWAGSPWGPGNWGADFLLPLPPPQQKWGGTKRRPPPHAPSMPSHPHCRLAHGERGPSPRGADAE